MYLISKKRVGVDNFCTNLPVLQFGLELLLDVLALLWILHGLISDDVLEVEIVLDDESRGEQVIVVDILHKWLDGRLSLAFLGTHFLRDLPWVLFDTSDESVWEFSGLKTRENER